MRLWRNQAFVVFWSARTISFAGTGITMVVLPVLVYGMTHSPAWVAALGLIEFVPYLAFGLFAGVALVQWDSATDVAIADAPLRTRTVAARAIGAIAHDFR